MTRQHVSMVVGLIALLMWFAVAGYAASAAPAQTPKVPRTILWSPWKVPASFQMFLGSSLMPTPRGIVDLTVGVCPYFDPVEEPVLGCATEIELWIAPDAPRVMWEFIFFHELGHIADFRHLSNRERAKITRVLKLDGLDWWGEPSWDARIGPPIPAEEFATTYADCAIDGYHVIPSPDAPGVHGFKVTPRSVCRMLARMVRS